MIYKKVFRSTKKISAISIGCLHFGTFTDKKESSLIINKAIDSGVNYFDTAPMYGKGNSEKILGDIFKNKRKDIMIGTKIGLKTIGKGINSKAISLKLTKKNIQQSINDSLKSLKTDYIDYFQLHYYDSFTPIDETFEELIKNKKEGKILHIGICNYERENLIQILKSDYSSYLDGLHCHYNIIERRVENQFRDLLERNKISLLCFQVLARGFLTGKYKSLTKIPINTRAHNSKRFERFFNENMFSKISELENICTQYNAELKDIAILWLIKNNFVSSAVMGFRNIEQFINLIECFNKKINNEVFLKINSYLENDNFLSNYSSGTPNPFMEY